MPFNLEKAMDNLAIRRGKKVLLFEYGTLMHAKDPPYTEDAWRKAEIHGNVHDVGGYKGATDIGKTSNKIKGEVAEISAYELEALDKREDVAKGDYERVKTKTLDGTEVYVYQWTGHKLHKAIKKPPVPTGPETNEARDKVKRALAGMVKPKPTMHAQHIAKKRAEEKVKVFPKKADKKGIKLPGGKILSSDKHAEPGWEGYNSHIIDGLDHSFSHREHPGTFTPDITFASKPKATMPHAILKGPTPARKFQGHYPNDNDISHFDDPKFTTSHREATYHKLANEVFGLGEYVPETTVFRHPVHKTPWSAQTFNGDAEPYYGNPNDFKHMESDIHKMAIMNAILGNGDRHRGNLLVSNRDGKPKPVLIDNGLSFDYHNIMGDHTPAYAQDAMDRPVPKDVEDWLWNLDTKKLADKLHESGAPQAVVLNAAKRLAATRRWSNMLKHGHTVYGKEAMKTANRNLHTLIDSIQVHKLGRSQEDQHKDMEFIDDVMLGRAKSMAEAAKMKAKTEMAAPGSFTERKTPPAAPVNLRTKMKGQK